jgi:Tfp pilus assembly ATPase PilU
MFPPAEHKLLLTQLAGNLEAIISQRLLICRDGVRRPAAEILRGGPVPTKFILEGRALELGDYMRGAGDGQQTFDQDLLRMFRQELITTTEALHNATNPEALQMTLRGIAAQGTVDAHERGGGGGAGAVDRAAALHARHTGGRPA